MISAKHFSISIAAGLSIWLGSMYHKNMRSYFAQTPAKTELPEVHVSSAHSIQVALLLDTSGSMSGLIEQAKSQLWKILNELSRMKKNGDPPTLEIALYEYGNPSRGRQADEIHQLSGFTTDMDLISEKLFSLTTNGGEEYCGAVIQASLDQLAWKRNDGMRIIYIAGNEPFTQGGVDYRKACSNALQQDVIVNTIYCGECETGIREAWQAGARAGGGEYLCIDHNEETVFIETPFDDEINRLNGQLNDTYIPVGAAGKSKKENQTLQDFNAVSYSASNATERAAFKSSKNYKAEDWDLVDAYKKDKKIVNEKQSLPDSLQNISVEQLEAKIEAISAQRSAVQQKIRDLDAQRRRYIEEQSGKQAGGGLENSILQSLRKQAEKKGFANL
jgi:hypothetical protein